MRSILSAYADIGHAILAAFRSPRVQALLLVAALIAAAAALVFHILEGWSYLDAFYFTVVSMATVGYGDLAPKTSGGRLFTIAFLVVGIGVFVLLVSALAEAVIREFRPQKSED